MPINPLDKNVGAPAKSGASTPANTSSTSAQNTVTNDQQGGGWLAKFKGEVKEAKDGFTNAAGAAVGYAELAGLKYPVKQYSSKLSDGLTRGSRIDTAQGYTQLKAQGFKGIVDLRAEGSGDAQNGATQAGLNVARIGIIDNTVPSQAQVKQFLDFVTNPANQPSYVHCEAGVGRTGVMSAAYRMAVQDWTPEQALAEAKHLGCAMPDQQQFILQLGQDLAAGKIPGYPVKA